VIDLIGPFAGDTSTCRATAFRKIVSRLEGRADRFRRFH